jgi:SRSO17 transposase
LLSPRYGAEWDQRLARYHRLAARAKAAAETGWFRAANDRYYREAADPAADQEAAFARLDRAEDLYWRRCTEPLQRAAVALALTAAPDLEALSTKMTVIRTHQLHEIDCMTRNCFEVLKEDIEFGFWT